MLAGLGLSACGDARGDAVACERINASIFRSEHQDDPAASRGGLPGVTLRVYGATARFAAEPDGAAMRIIAERAAVMQVQRANVVHYFRVPAGQARVTVDGDFVECHQW